MLLLRLLDRLIQKMFDQATFDRLMLHQLFSHRLDGFLVHFIAEDVLSLVEQTTI